MARPKKYTDSWILDIAAKMLRYAKQTPLPLKQDFAAKHRFPSEYLSRWAAKYEWFYQSLKRFEDIQQKQLIYAALSGKIDRTFTIFTLKNIAGWRDVVEQQGNQTQVNIKIDGPERRNKSAGREVQEGSSRLAI